MRLSILHPRIIYLFILIFYRTARTFNNQTQFESKKKVSSEGLPVSSTGSQSDLITN